MGFIFVMSTSVGSAEHTGSILEPLLRWLVPGISPAAINVVHGLVRKGAHVTEYVVLALLCLRAVRISFRRHPSDRFCAAAGFALAISVTYAATDEFHQSFVPGRTSSLGDVLIDACGASAALVVASLVRNLWSPRSPVP
jgi:VanZ family protein